jgi:hypothetical protein
VACFTHGQSSASSKSSEVGNQNVLLLMCTSPKLLICLFYTMFYDLRPLPIRRNSSLAEIDQHISQYVSNHYLAVLFPSPTMTRSVVKAIKVAVFSVVTHLRGASKASFANTQNNRKLPRSFPSPFPQEIMDAIISYLDNDRVALVACSLACSSFRRTSQKLIYTEITLKVNIGKIQQFCCLLTHNPRLSTYIRILVLELEIYNRRVLKCKALQTMLRKLSQLHSLSIHAVQLSWLGIPKSLKSVLIDLFRSQSIAKLMLSGLWDFPISLLHRNGQLKELHLRGVCPPLDNLNPTHNCAPPRRRPLFRTGTSLPALAQLQVNHLYLDFRTITMKEHQALALADVRKSISLSQLRHIHICEMNTTEAVNEFRKLLKQCPEPAKPFNFCMF